MEYYPGNFENPFSAPEVDKKKDDTEKSKEKKKSPSFSPEKRHHDAKKIAESLDKSSLFQREKEATTESKPDLKHLKEVAPADEAAAPTETMGEQERVEVAQELAAARREAMAAEAQTDDGDELAAETAVGIEAAEVFLQKVEATGDVEGAYRETAEEFGLAIAEADQNEPETSEADSDEPLVLEEGEIPLGVPETVDTDEEDTLILSGGGAGGGRGAGGTPPGGAGAGADGYGPTPPSGGGPHTRVIAPGINRHASPNVYTAADLAEAHRSGTGAGLLVGGILGYLIGRRRGRIKTEKRLMPIQKRLEKQVKTIQEQLYNREFEVRQLAAEKTAVTRLEQAARGVVPPERTRSRMLRRETRLGLEKPARAEKLGKVIIQAEAAVSVAPEVRKISPDHVKTMSRQEVVQLSEKILVEGTTLRQMYEDHLLGERGLRRVVTEFLKGHDIHAALKQELVEREIDFERDPMLRDKAYREMQQTRGGGASSLHQLLQQAGVNTTGDDQLSTVVKQLQAAHQESLQQESQRRRLADTAMITLIVILATVVAYLLFSK